MRILILNLLICASVISFAAEALSRPTATQLDGLIPSYLLNHSGFALPEDFSLAADGIGDLPSPLPLLPITKNAGGKQLLGVMVPSRYLGLPEADKPSSSRKIVIGYSSVNYEVKALINQLRQMKFSDGVGLNTYVYNNNVYAIRSDYQVNYSNETAVGLKMNFRPHKTVVLGQRSTYGIQLDLGASAHFLGGQNGFNFGEMFNDFFERSETLLTGDDAEKTIEKTVAFTPYIAHYLAQNAESKTKKDQHVLKATYRERLKMEVGPIEPLPLKVERSQFGDELKRALTKLDDNLAKEIKWKETVAPQANNQLILDDPSANQLIQNVCDHIASVYQVPKEIWPRCRIAATWEPNAWAFPGGDIFISAGLIGIISELDGVINVLGHEIGHVVGRHTTGIMRAQKPFAYFANSLALATQAFIIPVSLSGGAGYLGQVNWINWFPKAMAVGMSTSIPLSYAQQTLLLAPYAALMAYSRSHEMQADRFGLETSFAGGSDPEKIKYGWGEFVNFVNTYLGRDQSLLAKLLASHPNPVKRSQNIAAFTQSIAGRLEPYNAGNKMSSVTYNEYNELHGFLQSYVNAWGKSIKDSRQKNNGHNAAEFSLQSLLSPSGQCILHALGGE